MRSSHASERVCRYEWDRNNAHQLRGFFTFLFKLPIYFFFRFFTFYTISFFAFCSSCWRVEWWKFCNEDWTKRDSPGREIRPRVPIVCSSLSHVFCTRAEMINITYDCCSSYSGSSNVCVCVCESDFFSFFLHVPYSSTCLSRSDTAGPRGTGSNARQGITPVRWKSHRLRQKYIPDDPYGREASACSIFILYVCKFIRNLPYICERVRYIRFRVTHTRLFVCAWYVRTISMVWYFFFAESSLVILPGIYMFYFFPIRHLTPTLIRWNRWYMKKAGRDIQQCIPIEGELLFFVIMKGNQLDFKYSY